MGSITSFWCLSARFRSALRPQRRSGPDLQVPIAMADQNHGEAGKSSGEVRGGNPPAEARDGRRPRRARLPVASESDDGRRQRLRWRSSQRRSESLAIAGGFAWQVSARASEPLPFERVPLVYERASRRTTWSQEQRRRSDVVRPKESCRNRIRSSRRHRDQVDGLALPNLEEPSALIKRPEDQPAPQGFGYVGRHWTPRAALAGTYDAAWESERSPFLPDDFDERFFNGASPGLVATPHLRGGEDVKINNASSQGISPSSFRPTRTRPMSGSTGNRRRIRWSSTP